MKNTAFIFLFFVITLPLFSQEKVSNIKAETTQHLQYLSQYNGKQYVLEITPTDDVNVYQLESKDQVRYLWSRNLSFSFAQKNHFISGNRIVYSPGFGITSYDFVNNTGPAAYYYSAFSLFGSWIQYGEKSALFFDSKAEPFIYDLETKSVSDIYRYYINHNSQYPYVYSSGSAPNDLRHYYLQNVASDKIELLIESTPYEHIGNFDDQNNFWYLDKDMALVQVNLATANRKEFGLYAGRAAKKNIVLPSGQQVWVVQSTKDTTFLTLFDTAQKTKVKEFRIPIDGGIIYDRVAMKDDRMFIRSIKNMVFVVDLSGEQPTRSYEIYSNFTGKSLPVEKDHMLLPQKNGFLWIDLNSGNAIESQMPFVMSPLRDLQLLFAGNDAVFSATFTDTSLPTLFAINDGKVEELIFPSKETGCIADAQLYRLEDQLVLRDNYLYQVDDKESQLGTHKIIQYTQDVLNVDKNRLYFLQIINNRQHILFTDGFAIDTLCKLPTVSSYIKWVKKIKDRYFIVMDDDIREYDSSTGQFKFVQQGISGFKDVGNSLYFTANKLLYELNEKAKIVPYYLEMSEAAGYNVFGYRGNVLAISSGELYALKEGKFDFVSPYNLSSINYSRIGRYLLYHGFSEIDNNFHFFIVDENLNVDEIYFNGLSGNVINDATNEQFGLLKVNNSHTRIYDIDRKKVIELPPDKTILRWKYIYDGGNDTIAIIREGNQISSYRLSELYSQFELIDQLSYAGDDNNMSFFQYDDFVLITGAGTIKIILNNGDFLELAVNSNQIIYSSPINYNGYIYFMGNSAQTGRQVYRLLPQTITKTNEHEMILERVDIFPNPTSQVLNYELPGEWHVDGCQLYELDGTKHQCKVTNNQIFVDQLLPGLYILQLETRNKKVKPVQFIKI